MSKARKGKPNGRKGIFKHTEETKKKMPISKIGCNSPRKGVQLSEDTKRKISESKKGTPGWNKGKKLSEETIRKRTTSRKRNALLRKTW